MNFSLPQIQAFVATAETGSFQAAAIRLNKRSQAVSQLVAALEESNNVTLFTRKAKSLEITEAGRRLLSAAQRALNESAKLNSLLGRIDQSTHDKLTIAIDSFLVCSETSACCRSVIDEFPEIQLDILVGTTRDITNWVESGKADIGLQISTLDKSNQAISVNVFSFGLLIVAPQSVFRKGEVVTKEQLRNVPQLVYETVYDTGMDKSHIISDKVIATNNLNQILELVEQGMGWSIVPDMTARPLLESERVVEVSLDGSSHYQWMADCIYQDEDKLSLAGDYYLQKLADLNNS